MSDNRRICVARKCDYFHAFIPRILSLFYAVTVSSVICTPLGQCQGTTIYLCTVRVYVNTYVHAYIHTNTHTYIHTHVRNYTHTCILTNINTFIHIHTYVHTYTHTHIHICTQICGFAYFNTKYMRKSRI
jgi:hypothetical protein